MGKNTKIMMKDLKKVEWFKSFPSLCSKKGNLFRDSLIYVLLYILSYNKFLDIAAIGAVQVQEIDTFGEVVH